MILTDEYGAYDVWVGDKSEWWREWRDTKRAGTLGMLLMIHDWLCAFDEPRLQEVQRLNGLRCGRRGSCIKPYHLLQRLAVADDPLAERGELLREAELHLTGWIIEEGVTAAACELKRQLTHTTYTHWRLGDR